MHDVFISSTMASANSHAAMKMSLTLSMPFVGSYFVDRPVHPATSAGSHVAQYAATSASCDVVRVSSL